MDREGIIVKTVKRDRIWPAGTTKRYTKADSRASSLLYLQRMRENEPLKYEEYKRKNRERRRMLKESGYIHPPSEPKMNKYGYNVSMKALIRKMDKKLCRYFVHRQAVLRIISYCI